MVSFTQRVNNGVSDLLKPNLDLDIPPEKDPQPALDLAKENIERMIELYNFGGGKAEKLWQYIMPSSIIQMLYPILGINWTMAEQYLDVHGIKNVVDLINSVAHDIGHHFQIKENEPVLTNTKDYYYRVLDISALPDYTDTEILDV